MMHRISSNALVRALTSFCSTLLTHPPPRLHVQISLLPARSQSLSCCRFFSNNFSSSSAGASTGYRCSWPDLLFFFSFFLFLRVQLSPNVTLYLLILLWTFMRAYLLFMAFHFTLSQQTRCDWLAGRVVLGLWLLHYSCCWSLCLAAGYAGRDLMREESTTTTNLCLWCRQAGQTVYRNK